MAKKKVARGSARKEPARSIPARQTPTRSAVRPAKSPESAKSSARSTISGPSARNRPDVTDVAARKMAAAAELAAAMPENPTKADEYGDGARTPQIGAHHEPRDPSGTGSTLTEAHPSPKVGDGAPPARASTPANWAARPRARRSRATAS